MKRWILTLVVWVIAWPAAAQIEVEAAPSEAVELMNVVMSLTGDNPFANLPFVQPEYKAFVESRFTGHRDHSAVRFITTEIMGKGLMNRLETPAQIGVNSRIEQGAFVYTGNGEGWSDDVKNRFVSEVNNFYRDTGFDAFWREARERYDPITAAFRDVIIPRANIGWLSRFVPVDGARSYGLTLSYLCGAYNFGCTKDGAPNPVMGIPSIDGRPPIWEDQMGIYLCATALLHEYLHSFCNPLTDKYYSLLEGPGEVIYPKISEQTEQAFYGTWRSVLNEAFIRASVTAFMRSDDFFAPFIGQNTEMDNNTGIFWTGELADLLQEYEADRERYPSLDSFMPRIVEFYEQLSKQSR